MSLRFTKMHGCGNDYVYVDGVAEPFDAAAAPALAVVVSDRHKGVGSDGLIAVLPSERADVRMRMWNADGSEAQMCGNGVRCVAKLARERGYAQGASLTVEIGREGRTRVLEIDVRLEGERVVAATVDMGAPSFVRQEIPMLGQPGIEVVDEQIAVPGTTHVFEVTCVSMGNPHCVIFVDEDPTDAQVLGLGPRLETLRNFPERVNVGFARVVGPEEIRLRVWERGSGETQACGTGACACVAAAIRSGRIPGPRALVHLPGGDLEITWDRQSPRAPDATNRIRMTGPAVEVFSGVLADV